MAFGQLTMPPFPDLPYIPDVLIWSVYLKGIARGMDHGAYIIIAMIMAWPIGLLNR